MGLFSIIAGGPQKATRARKYERWAEEQRAIAAALSAEAARVKSATLGEVAELEAAPVRAPVPVVRASTVAAVPGWQWATAVGIVGLVVLWEGRR